MNPEASSMSMASTSQTGHANSADWQEEVYQQISKMKEIYYADLDEIYARVCQIVVHGSIVEHTEEQRVKLKFMKFFLEGVISFLQTPKCNIPLCYKDQMELYEDQIVYFLSSHSDKKPITSDQGQLQLHPHQTTSAADWQEEIYRKIMKLKEMYYADLDQMYVKVCQKLKHEQEDLDQMYVNVCQKLTHEQKERLKMMKVFLERIISFLQISKSDITLCYKDKVDSWEKQLVCFMNHQRYKKPIPSDQGEQQLRSLQIKDSADWREELYQKIKEMKQRYYLVLKEMSMKVNQLLSHAVDTEEKRKKLKMMKVFLERVISFLCLTKSRITLAHKDKMDIYEKHIVLLLNHFQHKKHILLDQGQKQLHPSEGHTLHLATEVSTSKTQILPINDEIYPQKQHPQATEPTAALVKTEVSDVASINGEAATSSNSSCKT